MSKNGIRTSKFSLAGDSHKGAFTFVEVIAALTIVSISLVALLKLNIVSINITDVSGIICEATFLANEKIAEALADGYPKTGADSGVVEKNALSLSWRREVSDVKSTQLDELEIDDVRRICVNVGWNKGPTYRHIEISTFVADRKLP
jgi:hypothetical protein